ncbi:ABC transporter ATP-binding protein [Staphylococcus agnetis]|uniref:ABC transporter ATP-binding protein n=1 Tax=Staphylococcus agnetis TaxID=985762 RepID=A0ABD7TVU2_9STAP|nr:ABC transporter ATP-binding protein [Staphylococcus agnetis]MDG4942831.1 ABC transporter ATP-binding protein [Staphylococcus agnetis]OSP22419.1 multidrug ABC transporter ATP-binding protein [Staphylococcus agnetis]OSP24242.1 multidrug ABC transporter ATP-binding protein [Staphylococcus agnetis]OTW30985.1 multidrug ABC transporter ATP-binding protein [Staphylococcus agnetis]UXU57072.1 ABC transporter ATP-binding protein [Staphylococcus agnetis]
MLNVISLSKKYKNSDFFSLNDVSFELNEGEIVGLIGNNGAGKTTLMKLIAKTLTPTSGKIEINHNNINEKSNSLKKVNFMIEAAFFKHISAYDNIKYYLNINKQNASQKQIQEVMQLVNLWHVKDKKPSHFSFGMKQRLGLAMCLASNPNVVIMDEPFVGLDPNGVLTLTKRLKLWAKEKNMAILISSHQLNELETICDRYLYLEDGMLKKSFNKSQQNCTLIFLQDPIHTINLKSFQNTTIENNVVKTFLDGNEFNELVNTLCKNNIIKKIERYDYLRDIFKGEDK